MLSHTSGLAPVSVAGRLVGWRIFRFDRHGLRAPAHREGRRYYPAHQTVEAVCECGTDHLAPAPWPFRCGIHACGDPHTARRYGGYLSRWWPTLRNDMVLALVLLDGTPARPIYRAEVPADYRHARGWTFRAPFAQVIGLVEGGPAGEAGRLLGLPVMPLDVAMAWAWRCGTVMTPPVGGLGPVRWALAVIPRLVWWIVSFALRLVWWMTIWLLRAIWWIVEQSCLTVSGQNAAGRAALALGQRFAPQWHR